MAGDGPGQLAPATRGLTTGAQRRPTTASWAWQHEAFLLGGAAAIHRTVDKLPPGERAQVIDDETERAWDDIESADPRRVKAGNLGLVRREQGPVIQYLYDEMLARPSGGEFTGRLTDWAEAPIPGAQDYRDFSEQGNIANYPDRIKWIREDADQVDPRGHLARPPAPAAKARRGRGDPASRLRLRGLGPPSPAQGPRAAADPDHPAADPGDRVTRRGGAVRRVVTIGLAALACLAVAGCGGEEEAERPAMRVDWDLSGEHTLDQVAWPREDLDITTTSVEPLESVRIALPAGQVLRMDERAKRIILYRPLEGAGPVPQPEGTVDTVEVYSEPLSVDGAYRRALSYVEQFDLSRESIDAWRERRRRGVEQETDRTPTSTDERVGGRGGPFPTVELLYSYNDERPWAVMVSLYWPPPREG